MTLNLGEKEFKVSEIVAAIEENGFDHLRGEWVHIDKDKIHGGCVLMQGALNLGVLPTYIQPEDDTLSDFLYDNASTNEGEVLTLWTGSREGTLVEELNKFPNVSISYPSDYIGKGCGDGIMNWNDKQGYSYENIIPKIIFALPTYEDVIKMVKDILAPYMNEVVTLKTVDFSQWEMKSTPA